MADVSRETTPDRPDPDVVAALFPAERSQIAEEYAALLASEGVLRGLIGPREVGRLWDRHLVNSALLAPLVPADATVADLGSGAGLPGLVVAIARPDAHVTLIEPMARRIAFLEEAVERLLLANVEVVRGRAEDWTRPDRFEVVTARALAPLPQLLRWALPLVTPGGAVLAMKGSSAAEEIESARAELEVARASAEVLHPEIAGATSTTVVKVVPRVATTIGWRADSKPRRGREDPAQRRGRERRRR
jgi:16S rRNA (guanine527-N7)-methyltransferase